MKEEKQDQLNWRAAPEESFSDWTIEIVSKQKDATDTANWNDKEELNTDIYHVHKCVIAFGTRKSDYFAKVFQNCESYNEGKSNTSRIELNFIAAKVFPQLLDFLYIQDKPFVTDTESATAFWFLCDYFQICQLELQAKKFCSKDMTLENVGTYYHHSTILHFEEITSMCLSFLNENIMSLSPSSSIVRLSEPTLWVDILYQNDGSNNVEFSLHMSDVIAEFCSLHLTGLDHEIFYKLTAADVLRHLSQTSALKLMQIADSVIIPENEQYVSVDHLNDLQERCVLALSNNWKELDLEETSCKDLLGKRKPEFLSRLLAKTQKVASQELKESMYQIDRYRSESTLYRCQLEECQRKLESTAKADEAELNNTKKAWKFCIRRNESKLNPSESKPSSSQSMQMEPRVFEGEDHSSLQARFGVWN